MQQFLALVPSLPPSATPDAVDASPTNRRPPPRWWDAFVVFLICHGGWFPPLWIPRWILTGMRSLNVRRALRTLDESGNGRNMIQRFTAREAEARCRPEFRRACEAAMKAGRVYVPLLRLPVFLDDEIIGRGSGPIMRHRAWRAGARKDPFPRKH